MKDFLLMLLAIGLVYFGFKHLNAVEIEVTEATGNGSQLTSNSMTYSRESQMQERIDEFENMDVNVQDNAQRLSKMEGYDNKWQKEEPESEKSEALCKNARKQLKKAKIYPQDINNNRVMKKYYKNIKVRQEKVDKYCGKSLY